MPLGTQRQRSLKKSKLGIWGEEKAAEYLRRNGFSIVGRRLRFGPHGELDIVVTKGSLLAFVEVKTRSSERYGRPAEAVNHNKQKILCKTAATFLRKAKYPNFSYRFDIVEIIGSCDNPSPTIRHIEDAFRFPNSYRFQCHKSGASSVNLWSFSFLKRLCVKHIAYLAKLIKRKLSR